MYLSEADWVKSNVSKVFTFGSPPIACIHDDLRNNVTIPKGPRITKANRTDSPRYDVITEFDLPSSIINSYLQPWDPCPRLFSLIDPLYPLVDDIGSDGLTLWSTGPNRALRPITRAFTEIWEKWPGIRDSFRETANQNYVGVGNQYLFLQIDWCL